MGFDWNISKFDFTCLRLLDSDHVAKMIFQKGLHCFNSVIHHFVPIVDN